MFVRWLTNRLLLVAHYSPFARDALPRGWQPSDRPSGSTGRRQGGPCGQSSKAGTAVPAGPPTGHRIVLGPAGADCDAACCGGPAAKAKRHFIGRRLHQPTARQCACAVELLPLVNPPAVVGHRGAAASCRGLTKWKKALAGQAPTTWAILQKRWP